MEQLPAYLTTEEVAERYRVSAATIRYWRHIGAGPRGVRSGTRVLYPAEEIRRYDTRLQEQAEGSTGTRDRAGTGPPRFRRRRP